MGRFFRWIAIGLLGLILILFGLVVLAPNWLPGLAAVQVNNLLKEKGFAVSELEFHQLDLSGIDLEIGALAREGITIEGGMIELDYGIDSLRRHEVESLVVSDLNAFVDLPQLFESMPSTSTSSPSPETKALVIPLKWFALEDVAVTLQAEEWSKTLSATANFDRGNPSLFFVEGKDALDSLIVSGEFDQSSFSGQATFKLDSQIPLSWLGLAEQFEFFEKPKGLELSTGAFGLEGAFRVSEKLPERWTILGALATPEVKFKDAEFAGELVNFGGRGNTGELEKLWFGLFGISLSYQGYVFSLNEVTLETLDPNQVYAKLTGLELSGNVPKLGLNDISLESGAVGTLIEGPWAGARTMLDLDQFSAKLLMPEAPLMLFTGLGSVMGDLGMEGRIGNEASRSIDWKAILKNAEISHSAAAFSAEAVSLSVVGNLPDKFSAVLELLDGQVTWAEGAGMLSQAEGEIRIDSLMPLSLAEAQVLTFAELRQGEIAISNGTITIAYQPQVDGEMGTVTATLGGDFAGGRLFGQIIATASEALSLEAKLVFDDIELETLAAYFPEFNGQIQGRVSGELLLRLEGKRLIVQPGFLEMKPGETGKFEYTRAGWLTQDPGLDPVAYVEGKDLVSLMKEPNGAAILTELAMRDLKMTAFRLDVLKPDSGDRRVTIHIEGDGSVKGVKVPVVQDIRVGGDVKETINMVLKLQEKVAF